MQPNTVAIVGAAETTQLGRIPDVSQPMLHADAALNTLADACLKPTDIDGVACAGESPAGVAHYLGIVPTWVDNTSVGGCSFMLHVRHAAAAINEGLCDTVLITHGESGRSGVGRGGGMRGGGGGSSLSEQFEGAYGGMGPTTAFTLPFLRYMKETDTTLEQLANVAVVQREWAGLNPRASYRDPISIDDVMNAKMIAYPFTKLECCLVTDGGGALILTSAERAKDFPRPPVYILGTGESVATPMVSQLPDLTTSMAFPVAATRALDSPGITPAEWGDRLVYVDLALTAFVGVGALGFCKKGEAGQFMWERNTAIGGKLPLNTNGGGLSYMHSGMYGMYALQESVRQLRGIASAQVEAARISVALGVGGMFAASGVVIMSNEAR